MDRVNDGRISHLQKTSCPREMRIMPATLMMANLRWLKNARNDTPK